MADKVAVVVPTCRPERLAEWFEAWREQFIQHEAYVYVIHDAAEVPPVGLTAYHSCWNDIQRDWADSAFIFPHNTDSIRCYGFWLAAKHGADVILTLDDDVVPEGDTIGDHLKALAPVFTERWAYAASIRTRGLPYRDTTSVIQPVISHGLWKGVPDLDAPSQLIDPDQEAKGLPGMVARGTYFPQSGMNLAFRREILPAMLWPPMDQTIGIGRFGDIWSGVIGQRICAQLNLPIMNAASWVRHDRLSDVFANLEKEATGIRMNESFWRLIDSVDLTGCKDAVDCVYRMATVFRDSSDPYMVKLADSQERWVDQVACVVA